MRMMSHRDERIIGELSRHARNDLEIVRKALTEINEQAAKEHRKVPIEDAIGVIDRLLQEKNRKLETQGL